MAQLSRKDASKVIADIREENGGISQEDREATPLRVLNALAKLRGKLAGASEILVNNLYSKETRFIYELLQNAEDNSYAKATRAKEKPFLTFRVHPDRIIVDSNEDGFHKSNVEAICSTGESTKANSEGYIGEKGIGFKSVFKIARKVHIQSEPFSFSFEHAHGREGDGLGMVTPMNEEFEELPAGIRTRMTLTLLDNEEIVERVLKDFQNIPDTLLLFLRKLQDLTIEIHPPDDAMTSTTYSKHEHDQSGLHIVNLAKFTQANATAPSSQQKFYVVKREVGDLPYDVARVDKNQKSINHATTILAFPVTENDVPMLEQQHVFAFLPLRQAGFKFLIQSDFVTQANREDVVHTPRNKAILAGVAMAFRDAVLQFCNHSTLRYQWMRFLPTDSISDEFWGKLWDRISDTLKKTPVLRSWSETKLHCPPQLRRLSPWYCDGSGQPLLPDLPQEIYLSPKYLSDDCQILQRLDLHRITWEDITDRLRADLDNPLSKWKTVGFDSDWRTRICDLLSRAFKADNVARADACKALKKMRLIPIENSWVSSERLTIYFPGTKEVPIPTDLRLNLVRMDATDNVSWRRLLHQLGVTECSPSSVLASIAHRYRKDVVTTISLSNSITHLRYLYWSLPVEKSVDDLGIWLFNHKVQPAPQKQHLYFEHSEDANVSNDLVELFEEQEDDDYDRPGYSVHFLHPDYIHAVDKSASRNGKSWLSWLETVARVRRNPQLCAKGSTHLSGEFQYIIEHRSERLVWILKRFWPIYEEDMKHVEELLRTSKVEVEADFTMPLNLTYLPLPRLKRLVEEYCVPNFPFITTSPQPRDDDLKEWGFLERLGIGIDDDIDFYVRAVTQISEDHLTGATYDSSTENAIFQLYQNIQKRCNEDLEMVSAKFGSLSLFYIPAQEGIDAAWVSAKKCIWDGPKWLRSKQRLNIAAYQDLEALVKTILKIPDASPFDVLLDLSEMKREKRGNALGAEVIYEYLWHASQSSQTDELRKKLQESLRDTFEKSGLVYVPHVNAWYPPSACVWAGPNVDIPGKASIATAFNFKKTFFTKVLKVLEPTAQMFIQSLKSQAMNQPTVSKVKETMKLISDLGVTAADVSELLGMKLFPIKLSNGQSCFTTASSTLGSHDFAIVDNLFHRNAFRGKVAMLDFTIEEIRDTRTFLIGCGLQNRFTPNLVEEVTDVEGGSLDVDMTKTLRLKSLALVRCATHYTTPDRRQDPNILYRLFRRATVFVSDGITQSMRIRLNGKSIEGERSRANFHLKESGEGLLFYLPKDEADREVCFEWHLPRRFREFLKITDSSAESVLGGVFRKQNLAVIERILDHAGVAQVTVGDYSPPEDGGPTEQEENRLPGGQQVDELPGEQEEDNLAREPEENELPSEQLQADHLNLARTQGQTTPSRGIRSSPTPVTPNQARGLLMPTSGQFRPIVSGDQDASYEKILENVVATARRRAANDLSLGEGSRDSLISPLDRLSPEVTKQGFGVRSVDRDRRVGAAGELYVFEYLQCLRLAGFNMSNWRSVIRDYVAVHYDYRDIQQWRGNSLADIEYEDVEGQLTKFLISQGHLAKEVWSSERPYYYFEVKASTSLNRQEPFFISRAQYSHLQEMHIAEGKASPKVYVIVRIYSLGQGDATGFDVYVDPESQRQQGRLEFWAETWAVKPNWTYFKRPGQSEDLPSPPHESPVNASSTIRESNSVSSSIGTQPTRSSPPSVTTLPDRTSQSLVGGEPAFARPSQPNRPSSSSDANAPAPANLSKRPAADREANTSFQQTMTSATQQVFDMKISPSPSHGIPSIPGNHTASSSVIDSLPKSSPKSGLFETPTKSGGNVFGLPSSSNPSPNPTYQNTAAFGTGSSSSPSNSASSPWDALRPKAPGLFGTPTASPSPTGSAQQGVLFGQTTPLAGNSLFGQKPLPTGTSLFGQTAPPAGGRLFDQASAPTGTGLFGQNPPPTGTGLFGQASSSSRTSPFSQTTPSTEGGFFGQASPPSGTGLFGQKPPPTGTGLFGQASSSSGTSLFAQTTPSAGASSFGQQAPSAGTSYFGQAPGISLFGQPSPSAGTTLFGQTIPSAGTGLFSQKALSTGTSPFGQASPSTATNAFGQTIPSTGTSPFGQAAPSNGTSPLGQKTTFVANSSGHQSQPAGTGPFGQNTPISTSTFGQASPSTASSPFGQPTLSTGTGPSVSLFGQAPPSTGKSLFGQAPPSTGTGVFGQAATNPSSTSRSNSPASNSPFGQHPRPSTDGPFSGPSSSGGASSHWTNDTTPMTIRGGKPPYRTDTEVGGLKVNYQSLTIEQFYQRYSFEELRLRDYDSGHRVRHLP